MKKFVGVIGLIMILVCLLSTTSTSVVASAATADKEISDMIQEHVKKAKIPSVSTAMIRDEKVTFLSGGEQTVDQNTLYQIGSTSKAFTALGILWLEDEGELSLEDPVAKHLPWFSMKFEGKAVPDEDLTIANLVYQTSGFTNAENKFPTVKSKMSLEEYGRSLSGLDLASYPSNQYAYANINYALLGLIIETVSGKSYNEFMSETIFKPLGLRNTYADPKLAQQEGSIIEGSRLAFFKPHDYQVAIKQASIPSGYIISNAKDISRWLQIQLGSVDVGQQMKRIIDKSHQPDTKHQVDKETQYAAGWFVSNDGTIHHSGGTPNYSTNFIIKPDAEIGTCVLTNINATVNTTMMAENIIKIMEKEPISAYQPDIWVTIDKIFSIMTIVCVPLIVAALILFFRIRKQYRAGQRTKKVTGKRIAKFLILPVLLLILAITMLIVFPIAFSSDWIALSVWAPYSLYSGIGSFTLWAVVLAVTGYAVSVHPKI